jgi:hypothetical protein
MAATPRVKDPIWIHADLVYEEIYCKYCKKCIRGGGGGAEIHRLKEHLAGRRGQVAPCMASLEEIGQISLELENQLAKFEKTRLGKKRLL